MPTATRVGACSKPAVCSRPRPSSEHQPSPRRSSKASQRAPPASSSATSLPLPPLEVIALNRLAFGPRDGDLDAFRQLGASDRERLVTYVDQQLNPGSIDDNACAARRAGWPAVNGGRVISNWPGS